MIVPGSLLPFPQAFPWACETDPEEPCVEWRDEEVHVNDMWTLRTIRHDQKIVKIRHQDFEETCFFILVRESHVKKISKYSILQRSWYCLLNSKHVSQVFAVNLKLAARVFPWELDVPKPKDLVSNILLVLATLASVMPVILRLIFLLNIKDSGVPPRFPCLQNYSYMWLLPLAPTKGSLEKELWTKLAERFRNLQVDKMSQFTQKDA